MQTVSVSEIRAGDGNPGVGMSPVGPLQAAVALPAALWV